MSNQTYLHFKDKRVFYEWGLCIILIIMWVYGFYKNGLSYVFLDKLSLLQALKFLWYPIVAIGIAYAFTLFVHKQQLTPKTLSEALICCLIIPCQFPLWLFVILYLLFLVVQKVLAPKFEFSWLALFSSLIFITSEILNISYYNEIEQTTPFLYGTIDIFLGRAIGSFGTTSILLILILYIFLATYFYYKRELPIYIITSYLLFSCSYFLFTNQPISFSFLLNNHLFFSAVIFCFDNQISPVGKHAKIFYGILIGLGAFLLSLWHLEAGVSIVFVLVSMIYCLLSKLNAKQALLCK